ncbi:hypothetical protein K1719_043347 [Acacia pycnantha]|nr:hypothetical protein K1719_043347 [Acacia pycnantha]
MTSLDFSTIASITGLLGEKSRARLDAEEWRVLGKSGSAVKVVSAGPTVSPLEALGSKVPSQQEVGEGSRESVEDLKLLGSGSVGVEASLGHEVDVAATEPQSEPMLLDKSSIQVARKVQAVEDQKALDHVQEDVVLQMALGTRVEGNVDGLIMADRGISPTLIGASHIVGLGKEVISCEGEEAICEEIKDQHNIAQTGGRRMVETCDRKKRGRPIRSGKAKAKVGSSGIASQGAANPNMGRQLRFLTSKYNISLVVLVETRTSGDKCLRLRRKVGFDSSFVEEAWGFSGGIWVLWKSQDVQVLL